MRETLLHVSPLSVRPSDDRNVVRTGRQECRHYFALVLVRFDTMSTSLFTPTQDPTMYIDGFLLPIPTAKLDQYREIAEVASKIYKEHGALSYHECVGDDLRIEGTQAFPDLLNCKEGETVMFSWAIFASREARDAANAKIMSDPRLTEACNPEHAPFDCARMAYGGFRSFVSA